MPVDRTPDIKPNRGRSGDITERAWELWEALTDLESKAPHDTPGRREALQAAVEFAHDFGPRRHA